MNEIDNCEKMHRFRCLNSLIEIVDNAPLYSLCTRFQANRYIELLETLRRELH